MLKKPWTPEQVANLNAFQRSGKFHPFTCGSGRRKDHADGEGVLVVTPGERVTLPAGVLAREEP